MRNLRPPAVRARSSRRFPALLALLAAAACLWSVLSWERAAADTYTVQPGDTLSGIAEQLEVDLEILMALNPFLSSPNAIMIGQVLNIPDNTAAEPARTHTHGEHTHTHDEDDYADAPEHEAVREYAEQVGSETPGSAAFVYVVQPGDTLWGIAVRYGIDTATLEQLNPWLNPHLLYVGAEIFVKTNQTTPPAEELEEAQEAEEAAPDELLEEEDAPEEELLEEAEPAGDARFSAAPTAAVEAGSIDYTVAEGDYATGIAEAHGISLQALQEHNPHLNFATIYPGQTIQIPVPDYNAPALDPQEAGHGLTDVYTVRSGDNATYIAELFDLTLAELRTLNSGTDLDRIYIGQTLIVPWTASPYDPPPGTAPAVEVRRRTHKVQPGDTFNYVAELHGLTLEELRAENPLRPNDLLVVGELLYLPGVIEPPAVAEDRTVTETDLLQYASAQLGVTPHTLLANHGWLAEDQWLEAGSVWRLPLREGLLVTVQAGDTLLGIALAHGVDMNLILADPAHGVDDPNQLIIGQQIILPLSVPDFHWPAIGPISDPFGICRNWDCSYRHNGLDLALDTWHPLEASAPGLVTFVGGDPNFGKGNYVEVEHGNGWRTIYAHLVEFNVVQGQYVETGDVIGYNGNTGYSTGPHLHFEIHHHDWYIDPLIFLPPEHISWW